jgi:hypothetical protein
MRIDHDVIILLPDQRPDAHNVRCVAGSAGVHDRFSHPTINTDVGCVCSLALEYEEKPNP